MDKYNSFQDLVQSERQEEDFRIRLTSRPGSTVVIAPHGGGIEPGTSEIAEAIAGNELSFYTFEGIKSIGNRDLHITSTHFDEPNCLALVVASPRALAIHGEDSEQQVVFLGGRNMKMLQRLCNSLISKGFTVKRHKRLALQGQDEANICNRVYSRSGVQIELSNGLRRSFFKSLSRKGRQFKTERFEQFVAAVRKAIL
jgi:phage replication-related protein YjqB (UPF0714/DUF867 family)